MLTAIWNFLHLFATVIWVGGMLYATLVLSPAMEAIDPPQRGRLMGAVGSRFTRLVWGSIVVLLITGLFKTPPGQLFSLASADSILLTVKHLVVLMMLVNATLITFVFSPKMAKPASPEASKAQKRMEQVGRLNTLLGVLLLLLVAFL